MKAKNKIIAMLVLGCSLAFGLSNSFAQLQFTQIRANDEAAIKLTWESETNTTYRIEYADEVIDVNIGSTVWQTLYDNYPSHGTNSFVLDTGNQETDPLALHPKKTSQRFYRIKNIGQNTGSNPTVVITAPTNSSVLSGEVTITVAASSDQNLTSVRLYVDGEEQYDSDDGTNFVINTCEWGNGPHVLFAVAKSQSGFWGIPGDNSVTYGSAVSSYVNVTFSNLITRYDFSEAVFAPEAGQTQTVSAVFAANVNWTLQIQDPSSNTVRSFTGSGSSMSLNFDGYDTGGTILTPDLYWYVLTVETNGQALSSFSEGSGFHSFANMGQSPEETLSEDWYPTSAKEALANGLTSFFVKTPPLPSVRIKTNGFWMTIPSEEIFGPRNPIEVQIPLATQEKFLHAVAAENGIGFSTFAFDESSSGASAAAYNGPSAQSTKGPQRKPKERHIGVKGNFGILYQDYPDGLYCRPPKLKINLPPYYVKIDGNPVGGFLNCIPVPEARDMANAFIDGMKNSGYTNKFSKGSGKWTVNDLKGVGASINSVNLGLLISHASYGETTEQPDGLLHTYIWLADGTYAKLGEMSLGGAAPSGLRWMTMHTCNTLREANMQTYVTHNWMDTIINDNLHLLLGTETVIAGNKNTLKFYAKYLKEGQTLPNAWQNALREAIRIAPNKPANPVTARVMGHPPCFSDKLMDWSDPDPGINSASYQVYP